VLLSAQGMDLAAIAKVPFSTWGLPELAGFLVAEGADRRHQPRGHLYAIADGEVIPEGGEPEVIFCADEFGPLNLQPRPGRQWAAVSGKSKEPGREPRPAALVVRTVIRCPQVPQVMMPRRTCSAGP
jgi:hypothetical protein